MKLMNEVSIIINGVRYDAVKGIYCSECVFDIDCEREKANLCSILDVFDCGFKKSDKKFEP